VTASRILAKMRQKQGAYKPGQEQKKRPPKFRLPDGTRVEAVYDAASGLWTVTMTTGDGKVYTEKQPSVEYSTRKCGIRWRKEQKAAQQK
jgi:hypothetical protein